MTIAEALAALPCGPGPHVVMLPAGTFRERVSLERPGVTLKGAGAGLTRVVAGAHATQTGADGRPIRTFATATVFVGADDCGLEDLTVENDAGPGEAVGQAVALYADGDRFTARRCGFAGHQDTVFVAPLPATAADGGGFGGPRDAHPRTLNRMLFTGCRIEGDVDFIFGGATAVFHRCTVVSRGPGWVTAAATPEGVAHGLVFVDCRFEGPGEATVWLGRPWRDFARTTVLGGWLGAHLKPEGWEDWGRPQARSTVRYAVGGAAGPGYHPEALARWTRVLSSEELERWTPAAILSGPDGWAPALEALP